MTTTAFRGCRINYTYYGHTKARTFAHTHEHAPKHKMFAMIEPKPTNLEENQKIRWLTHKLRNNLLHIQSIETTHVTNYQNVSMVFFVTLCFH